MSERDWADEKAAELGYAIQLLPYSVKGQDPGTLHGLLATALRAAAAVPAGCVALSKLPKTADGEYVYPGMKAFVLPIAGPDQMVPTECVVDMITSDVLNGHPEVIHVFIHAGPYYFCYTRQEMLFSTREAAQAALAAREGK